MAVGVAVAVAVAVAVGVAVAVTVAVTVGVAVAVADGTGVWLAVGVAVGVMQGSIAIAWVPVWPATTNVNDNATAATSALLVSCFRIRRSHQAVEMRKSVPLPPFPQAQAAPGG